MCEIVITVCGLCLCVEWDIYFSMDELESNYASIVIRA